MQVTSGHFRREPQLDPSASVLTRSLGGNCNCWNEKDRGMIYKAKQSKAKQCKYNV